MTSGSSLPSTPQKKSSLKRKSTTRVLSLCLQLLLHRPLQGHSVNGSLANLGESLHAIIDFQPQPLEKPKKKQKKQHNFFCCCAVDIISPLVFLLDGTCPPCSLLPGLLFWRGVNESHGMTYGLISNTSLRCALALWGWLKKNIASMLLFRRPKSQIRSSNSNVCFVFHFYPLSWPIYARPEAALALNLSVGASSKRQH